MGCSSSSASDVKTTHVSPYERPVLTERDGASSASDVKITHVSMDRRPVLTHGRFVLTERDGASSASYEQSTHVSMDRRPVLTHGSSVLTERDAWDIALAWRDQLRGCVRLKTVTECVPISIIPSFEWVMFVFHGRLGRGCQDVANRPKAAAYARAATIAWFALSCCKGYSGVENPQFWKRVFYELLYPEDLPSFYRRSHTYPYPKQLPITDAIRFFSHPDRPFPRIKLAHGSDDDDATIASVFLGRLSLEDEEREEKLEQILVKLEPFMRKSDVTRSVPVELNLREILTSNHAELLRNFPRQTNSKARAIPSVASVASMMEFSQLYLHSVNFTDNQALDIQILHSQMPPSNVEVLLGGSLSSFVRDHQLWRGLQDQLQDDSSVESHRRWRVTHVDSTRNPGLSYSLVGVICSALPHLQSSDSLKLSTGRYVKGKRMSNASDWAWLGYAIFHPAAALTSGFKSLEVDLDGISLAHIAALTRMATGNNLRGGKTTGYRQGLVRSGTEVKIRPENDDKMKLFTFTTESWVSVCAQGAKAVDLLVVVPGFGCGWIRHDDIVETRTRRAGASCIRALRVKNYTQDPVRDSNEKALLDLLRVLGSRLTSLHFENSNHTSASSVHAILRLCPSLKSLRIHHDGSFWADETLVMEMPRLEELELTVHGRFVSPLTERERDRGGARSLFRRYAWETGPVRPLQGLQPACLPYLKALHVTSARSGAYTQHESVLVSFLSKQPVLRYLHWSRGYTSSPTWADAPAYRENEGTLKFLALLPAEHHFSSYPLQLDCRLAFLSVIAAQNSVGVIAQDVVMLIFQYVPSRRRREIFINPYIRQPNTIWI